MDHSKQPKQGLLEKLIGDNRLTLEQAYKIKEMQKEFEESIPFWICKLGFLKEEDLIQFIKEKETIEIIDLHSIEIPNEVLQTIPEKYISSYQVLPIRESEDLLTIAISDPYNIDLIKQLSFATGCRLELTLVGPHSLRNKIDQLLGGTNNDSQNQATVKQSPQQSEVSFPNNRITFFCGACKARFEVTNDKIGKQFLCDKCHQPVVVPEKSPLPELIAVEPVPAKITFNCGSCNAIFDVTSDKIGKQFLCDKCHQPMTVPEKSTAVEEPPKEVRLSRASRLQKRQSSLQRSSRRSSIQEGLQNTTRSGTHPTAKKTNNTLAYVILGTAFFVVLLMVLTVFQLQKKTDNNSSQKNTEVASNEEENIENKVLPPKENIKTLPKITSSTTQTEKRLKELAKKLASGAYSYKAIKLEYEALYKEKNSLEVRDQIETALSDLSKAHEKNARAIFNKIDEKSEKYLLLAQNSKSLSGRNLQLINAKHLWQNFPKEFEFTHFWEEKEKKIQEIKQLHQQKFILKKTPKKIILRPLSYISFLQDEKKATLWKPVSGKWGSHKSQLVGKTEKQKGEIKLGETSYRNFILTFKVFVEKGRFIAKFHIPEKDSSLQIATLSPYIPLEQWLTIKVEYKNGQYLVQQNNGTPFLLIDTRQAQPFSNSGSIALGCDKNSLVYYKDVSLNGTSQSSSEPQNLTQQIKIKNQEKILSQLQGKVSKDENTYTLTYNFSNPDELNDFAYGSGSYHINKKVLVGKNFILLKGLEFKEYDLSFKFSGKTEGTKTCFLFSIQSPTHYHGIEINTKLKAILLVEYAGKKKHYLEQGRALHSILTSPENRVKIKYRPDRTKIYVNKKLMFDYEKPLLRGEIGFYGKDEIKIRKLKIVGKN